MARRSNNGRSGATRVAVQRAYVPSWVHEPLWDDLAPGDPVKVQGEYGNFIFRGTHVRNGEVIAVHCHGGPSGNTTNRFFTPERVTKVKAKRKRRTKSDAEA